MLDQSEWWEALDDEVNEESNYHMARLNDDLRSTVFVGGRVEYCPEVLRLTDTEKSVINFHLRFAHILSRNLDNQRSHGIFTILGQQFQWHIEFFDLSNWRRGIRTPCDTPNNTYTCHRVLRVESIS